MRFPASRRKTLFGETPNTTREDAYAPQTLRRRRQWEASLRTALTKFPGERSLLEPSLDDGKIVVQNRRSAKLIDMIQEFIH